MTTLVQRFLYFIKTNFWDWQIGIFILTGLLIASLIFLKRQRFFENNFFDFAQKAARKDFLNALLIVFVNLLLCLLLVLIAGVPVAQTHDEFGYLLAADTFLQGRTANPTPFSPEHFEYFHILLKPVYAAKYPPLQGAFLAFGTLISGFPIAGVWLSGILAALSIYWFLRGFLAPGGAFYGTLLWLAAPLNFIWSDSYWGGHLAVAGGALSLGAFFRFEGTGRIKYLLIWGVGIFFFAEYPSLRGLGFDRDSPCILDLRCF